MNDTLRIFLRRILLIIVLMMVGFCAWWLLLYDNYHEVIPGQLYRSGQMSVTRLCKHADRDHLATVINLRPEITEAWHDQEVRACIGRGIRHVDFPMSGDIPPTTEAMDDLLNLMRRSARPLLIHCEHGADRTGLAVALYLRTIDSQPEIEARKALSMKYGHLPRMKAFDEAFGAHCRK